MTISGGSERRLARRALTGERTRLVGFCLATGLVGERDGDLGRDRDIGAVVGRTGEVFRGGAMRSAALRIGS